MNVFAELQQQPRHPLTALPQVQQTRVGEAPEHQARAITLTPEPNRDRATALDPHGPEIGVRQGSEHPNQVEAADRLSQGRSEHGQPLQHAELLTERRLAEPLQQLEPVVIPDVEPDIPATRLVADEPDDRRYLYIRIVEWFYDGEEMSAEVPWHNTIEPVRNLTPADQAEAQHLLRAHQDRAEALRRNSSEPTRVRTPEFRAEAKRQDRNQRAQARVWARRVSQLLALH